MEKQYLEDYLRTIEQGDPSNTTSSPPEPWYNPYGDCIEYQTSDVAVVAKRIDEFLTIYKSAETDEPIGFQLKDVKSFIEMSEYDGLVMKIETEKGKFVSLTGLFIKAIEKKPASVSRRSGYQQAMKHLTSMSSDKIPMSVATN